MMIEATLNGQPITVKPRTTILDAAKAAGIQIPTLCYLEKCQPIGACRVCVVELDGKRQLVAACSTMVDNGMNIQTNSARVRASRKMTLELLLSEHDGECQVCDRNHDCELQHAASLMNITEVTYEGERTKTQFDTSTPALVRNSGKCIKCRRCSRVCADIQGVGSLFPQERGFSTFIGPAFSQDLDQVPCVQCGQCAAVCPVSAIIERRHIDDVWAALDDPTKHVIVQTAPAIRASLGECFDNPPGTLVTGKMVTALRRMGFNGVFDTNFTADLTIIEEGTELLSRLRAAIVERKQVALPPIHR